MTSPKKDIRFSCPLDCFDVCSLVATVVDNRVTKIRGGKNHPLTRGVVCIKGLKLLERQYHPQRLNTPLKKLNNKWVPMTWPDALDEIAERLLRIIDEFGSSAVLHYVGAGHGGLAKKVDEVFFNYLGGVSVPRGSLCWGAGIAAQRYDFGEARGHHPADFKKSNLIILWGRNPADTNRHLVPFIRQARQSGAPIVLIDPRRTASAELADRHIVIRPATDGALALAMAHTIIETDRCNMNYVKKHVLGFNRLREAIKGFTPEWASEITGIPPEMITSLAQMYSGKSPASIVIGYGLQRYSNGGNTVRSIDILGAITGNIGVSGGGVNYANHFFPHFIGGDLKRSRTRARNRRTFSIARLAEYLESEKNPPIQCIFVTKSNPLVQGPDINRSIEAFKSVDFKVVVDMFMTDTAQHADIVLPCTSVLEEEDVIFSSMFSPYVNYSGQAVNPPRGILSDYDFYGALAERMGISDFPRDGRRQFLKRAIEPLIKAFGVSLSDLEQSPFSIPKDPIPWENGQFSTPSGKIELYSEKALADGHSPTATYIQPKTANLDYPLRLLTPHRRASMHSQHFAFIDDIPEAVVRPETLRDFNLTKGARAKVWSEKGEIIVKISSDQCAAADAVTIDQGWWHKSGSVNKLTSDHISEMGEQAAYYECFVNIAPAN